MRDKDLTQRLAKVYQSLSKIPLVRVYGRLSRIVGLTFEATGCDLATGDRCCIERQDGFRIEAEVVGFHKETFYLMPLIHAQGFRPGDKVIPMVGEGVISVGDALLGRVINGLGVPIDGKPIPASCDSITWHAPTINPLSRKPIDQQLEVGVRAIDGMLSVGCGQRIGMFAGSGVGKSVLLGMLARNTRADVVIVGLIGERGREVREFIEHSLGEIGLKKATVIAAPADDSPVMRLRAAELTHRMAEYYREQGKDVLLLMDSLTRYAMAQREIALAVGEPPATKGYPPSVFSLLPKLVERAGNGLENQGSITAFYTVLAEGDDQQDPIADATRAILDGHIVLDRELAEAGHYPAIQLGQSISRVMPQIVSEENLRQVYFYKSLYARYQQSADLVAMGGYQEGADPKLDLAIKMYDEIRLFLCQGMFEISSLEQTKLRMNELHTKCGDFNA